MNLLIESHPGPFSSQLIFEIVERKGIGHPDTLADAIAENTSRLYSQYCLEKFGRVAHHWFDKVMLIGGQSEIHFGKGKLIQPYKVIFAGKAALSVGNDKLPLKDIANKAASEVLSTTLFEFNPKTDLEIDIQISNYRGPGQSKSRYHPASVNELFDIYKDAQLSNDCNICTGYYPLSTLEEMVVSIENFLSSKKYKKDNPDTGFDIKIVGTRKNGNYEIFVNIPFIAKFVPNLEYYLQRVEVIKQEIIKYVQHHFSITPQVIVNPEKYSNRVYLTVTGSVADTGDIGVVGRGNRINGLITPMRMMSVEASSGKNPIDHTGKIYGIYANRLAKEIYEKVGKYSQVIISTWKEKPVNQPQDICVQIENWEENSKQREEIETFVKKSLNAINNITIELVKDGIVLW